MTRSGLTSAAVAFAVVAISVASLVALVGARSLVSSPTATGGQTSQSSTVQSGSTSTVGASPGATSASVASIDGLELLVNLNATTVLPGESVEVNISEFNTRSAVNNVPASNEWPIQVSLGPCENTYDQPFGIAVYYGHVDAQNVSQGQRVAIFPPVACPMYVRLVTGYEFQPQSDLALVLPGSGTTPSPLVGSVNVGEAYSVQQGQPLSSGSYTVVAADEWGALTFLYFQVG